MSNTFKQKGKDHENGCPELKKADAEIFFEDNLIKRSSVLLIFFTACSGVVFCAIYGLVQYNCMKNELIRKGERYVGVGIDIISDVAAPYEDELLQKLFERVLSDQEIEGIFIEHEKLKFVRGQDLSAGTLLTVAKKIVDPLNGRALGGVEIFLSDRKIKAQIFNTLIIFASFFAAFGFLLFIVTRFFLKNLIVKPVNDLSNFVFDYFRFNERRKFHFRERNEIGRLAHSFNSFAEDAADRFLGLNERVENISENLARAKAELKRQTRIDSLTQLCNRKEFDRQIDIEWRRMQRQGRPISLILCDVDRFGLLIEEYGRAAGDDCMRELAKIIKKNCGRVADLPARFGGKRFAALLPETDSKGALTVAKRIRSALDCAAVLREKADGSGDVTLSFGVATVIPGKGGDSNYLVAVADSALYESREKGGDWITANPD
jgi:diguanylate cyclase (GGDEF)-like protein